MSVEQVVGRAREAELGQRERYFLYRWFTGRPMGFHGGVLRGSKKSNHLLIEFDDEGTVKNPIQLIMYFPYALIAPLFVMPALIGHIITIRILLHSRPDEKR